MTTAKQRIVQCAAIGILIIGAVGAVTSCGPSESLLGSAQISVFVDDGETEREIALDETFDYGEPPPR